MGNSSHEKWRQVGLLTGMYLVANVETIAADQTAALGVSVTVVRSCQFDSSGLLPAGMNASANTSRPLAVRCGTGAFSPSADNNPAPLNAEPDYQLSYDNSRLTLTVSF